MRYTLLGSQEVSVRVHAWSQADFAASSPDMICLRQGLDMSVVVVVSNS